MTNEVENSPDHCGQRFQRRRRHPGGPENHDGERGVRDERHHRPDGPEHPGSDGHPGGDPRVSGPADRRGVRGYPPRRRQDRDGVLGGVGGGDRPAAAVLEGGEHRGGPGNGGHQRLGSDRDRRCNRPERAAAAPGHRSHPQHPGSRSALGAEDWVGSGDAGGGRDHPPGAGLRRPAEGRARHQRRQRPALVGGRAQMVLRQADR